ncbi:MAG: Trk system potassium transporter TrkA [Acidobacteriota bacterium]
MKNRQNILILGLGGVGRYLTEQLVHEGHAITVIESDAEKIRTLEGEIDARLIQGDAMSTNCWLEADAPRMDYLIAVTNNDAVNVLASMIGDSFGIARKIARVRSRNLWGEGSPLTPDAMKIDLVIQPEELAAQEIAKLLTMRWGNSVIDLADGEMQVVGTRISKDSLLADLRVRDIAEHLEGIDFRIVAIARELKTVIPDADEVILPGDYIYLLVNGEHVPSLMLVVGMGAKQRQRVMIIGGGDVGGRAAQLLQGSFRLKLVERDPTRAEELAEKLKKIEILHGDGADHDTLVTAGLLSMDTVIAATGDNETNIMASALAKQLIRNPDDDGVGKEAKTIALVQREQYLTLASAIGTDIVLSKKVLAGDSILAYILRGELLSVAHLHGVDAEVVELVAGEKALITKHTLADVPGVRGFTGRLIIGCVHQDGQWRTVGGSTRIAPGERVIAVCRPEYLPEVERLVLG